MQFKTAATAMAAIAFMITSVAAAAPAPTSQTLDTSECNCHVLDRNDLQTWLDGFVNYAIQNGDIAGGVISVVKGDEVLLQKGFGYADVATGTRMDPQQTLIRAGSTAKLFTWTSVMQLVELGKLDLNRDINDYLDFKIVSTNGKPITLLDLMHHRGGFEEGLKGALITDPQELESTQRFLKEHQRPMLFAPGAVPAYSNYGAALAGYIVERVSGEPFERYVERHLFAPLGMTSSSFDQPLPERFKERMSRGYRTASAPPLPYELIQERPAGSLTTTASDMARFMMAHLHDGRLGDVEILRVDTAHLMHSPSQAALPGFSTFAHGFFYEHRNGRTVIGHGGDTILFHTEFNLLPEEGVGIFYTFNSRGRDDAVYGVRKALMDGFMDRYFPTAAAAPDVPTVATAHRDAAQIAGRYQSSRRIEHGFMSVFYLLQQAVIRANADGTVALPKSFAAGEDIFREVAANLWQQVGGNRQLALLHIDGFKTVVDSDDASSVLQAVPWMRSAALNVTVLLGSFVILILAVIAWPLSWLRKRSADVARNSPALKRLQMILLIAALVDLLYLVAWALLLRPVMNLELDMYSTKLDPVVRTLQWAGLLVIVTGAVGVWSLWRTAQLQISIPSRLWNVTLAAALLGTVWIGWMGNLIGFELNY